MRISPVDKKSAADAEKTSAEALFRYGARLCARREYSMATLREKLRARGGTETDTAAALARLHSEHFVDDERYARAFAHDHFAFSRWGRCRVAAELARKGVKQSLIARVIEEEAPPGDGHEELLSLLRQKIRLIGMPQADATYLEKQRFCRRLLTFAASRGFEATVALKTVDRLLAEIGGDEEW